MVKKVFVFLSVLILSIIVFQYRSLILHKLNNIYFYSRCDITESYTIDYIDPKFNISKAKLTNISYNAASIWNQAAGKRLFIPVDKGDIKISLVYDSRQALDSQIDHLETELQTENNILQKQIADYKQNSADFKDKLDQLNTEINEWNNKGGAPPEVFERLTQQQQALRTTADELNNTATVIRDNTAAYNDKVKQINSEVKSFNKSLQYRPEEGLYDPKDNSISIFFYNNDNELVHTLAHEFGHALNIGHNKDPQAVMFAKVSDNIQLTRQDLKGLSEACAKKPRLIYLKERLTLWLNKLKNN